MFGRVNGGNAGFPAFAGENGPQQFDESALPKLQLSADFPVEGAVDRANGIGNELAVASTRPVKRARGPEPISMQQLAGTILNHNHVSTGLKLSYEEDEHKSSVTTAGENMKAFHAAVYSISNNVTVELDRQNQLIDHCIRAQEKNIMNGLRELNLRHTTSLIRALEGQVAKKLQAKQVELENMCRKIKELTLKNRQLAMEVQSWQLKAQYNESLANALQAHLEQVIAQGFIQAKEGYGDSEVDGAASYIIPGNLNASENALTCKGCNHNEVSIMLLPCRHLCLCKKCEPVRQFCPVCHVVRTASVEVILS